MSNAETPKVAGFIGWANARMLSREPRSFEAISVYVYKEKQADDDQAVYALPPADVLLPMFLEALQTGVKGASKYPSSEFWLLIDAKARELVDKALGGQA